ncbi:MAG: hypothetical protein HWN65_23675 [Candidatus Helarchaeota archaeon]|nr:hypothetical protein [Candidatus Helarchaeota archaeon]
MPKKKDKAAPKGKAKRKKWGASDKEKEEHFERDIFIKENLIKTIKDEVPKMKMITLSSVAQKYNIRISVVKRILNDLVEENKIKPFIQSNRLKVFVRA